ncbi:hypothetical protein RBH29_00440 [Herbivorax sp. ANBcel31]|uniref:hypothetical protein n=1 Tax=Herbivorax sp. ANBcel31 TaxID=3069754 RepID=UPI0027B09EFB|nr:hypothetical protein [Herbivorax sp. ANBcel31]MDQ2084904.1 hypothetical protein [Herbivorax sp. ANBcel31]
MPHKITKLENDIIEFKFLIGKRKALLTDVLFIKKGLISSYLLLVKPNSNTSCKKIRVCNNIDNFFHLISNIKEKNPYLITRGL